MGIGVYRITNTTTGKVYVGASTALKSRIYHHKWQLKRGEHHSFLLQRAWDKHGPETFVFDVVEVCERDKLPIREQHWIDKYDCANPKKGYNRSPTAGTTAGCVKTPETRERISDGKLGSIPWNKGIKGLVVWADDDPRRESPPAAGRARTTDEKMAISEAHKKNGHKPSKAALKASADSRRGKPSHANQKSAMKRLWADPVWRANMLEKRRLARKSKSDRLISV